MNSAETRCTGEIQDCSSAIQDCSGAIQSAISESANKISGILDAICQVQDRLCSIQGSSKSMQHIETPNQKYKGVLMRGEIIVEGGCKNGLENSLQAVLTTVRSPACLRSHEDSFKPDVRGRVLTVARREIVCEVESRVTARAGLCAGAARDPAHHRVRVGRDAVGRIDYLDERVRFDEYLIATLHVGVSRFQIEDEIGVCIRAG